ncbi:MarR family winged helix-turn-helix transcriptional regulator [Streptomyces odontomachi]|uniref:MarR family winged helix-turn-helix transcriptional regulator n=1 Tax=Streptomyces odontomachi TaxID=2944940 RepID=UPI00272E0B22|nr:MarR family transcriptional regulator [Streptomyces sp. ODS25]
MEYGGLVFQGRAVAARRQDRRTGGAVSEAAAQPAGRGANASPSLLYLLKRTELVVRARLDEVLKPSGVTALQYTALTVLQRHGSLTAAQLARFSFVTAQSMADMVRTLQARGHVVRRPNPDNRRELLLALTDLGHRLLADYEKPVHDLELRMTEGLTAEQRAQLRLTLDHAWRQLS